MGSFKKTDNHDPTAKLDLRRYFLRKYHARTPIHVLDCCQGSGLLWAQLRKEFPVESYWGLDLKPKAGRLQVDSARVLAQPGWSQNVIDVDTYGSPWAHWEALLPQLRGPTTVFLTIGQVMMGVDSRLFKALGMGKMRPPQSIGLKLSGIAVSYLLAKGCDYGIIAVEAAEAASGGSARYIGIHLKKGGSVD